MKRKFFIMAVVGLMVCLIGFGGSAYPCDHENGHWGESNKGHLKLYQKIVPTYAVCLDPSDPAVSYPYPCSPVNDQDPNWIIPLRGARGKLEYRFSGPIFYFEFEGHRLEPGQSYTLIYYPDNWFSGSGLIHLGSDVADKHGNVQIRGSLDIGSLPALYDDNCIKMLDENENPILDENGNPICDKNLSGAKIWLVLSGDICFRGFYAPYMIGWNPDKYLFEDRLITFDSPEDRDCY